MLRIGLTGGIASGKSLVSSCFTELGSQVIDADKIANDLFSANSIHLDKLRDRFGDRVFFPNGELHRKSLGKIVFADPKQLEWLNQFSHPLINTEMKAQISESQSAYLILDIPLLVDTNGNIPNHLSSLIDRILVVDTKLETQIARLIKRDKISKQEALTMINSQSSLQQKLTLADDIIDNNANKEQLRQQVEALHKKYLKLTA